jgi:hypothetical protein
MDGPVALDKSLFRANDLNNTLAKRTIKQPTKLAWWLGGNHKCTNVLWWWWQFRPKRETAPLYYSVQNDEWSDSLNQCSSAYLVRVITAADRCSCASTLCPWRIPSLFLLNKDENLNSLLDSLQCKGLQEFTLTEYYYCIYQRCNLIHYFTPMSEATDSAQRLTIARSKQWFNKIGRLT